MAADDKKLLNDLKDWDDEELRAAAAQVADVVNHPGYRHLMQAIEELRIRTMAKLEVSGHPGQRTLDQSEYTRLAGVLYGLKQSQVAADSFAAALEQLRERNTESP